MTTTTAPAPAPVSLRDRVRLAILCLDASALYGEVFGLGAVAEQYRSKAEGLLEQTRAWPSTAMAVSVCPCGRVSWLEAGASVEELEAFDADNNDHDTYCDAGLS